MTDSKMETVQFPNPLIHKNKFWIKKEDKNFRIARANRLRQSWGEPDEISKQPDGKERWIYNRAPLKTGALIVVGFIPIPLYTESGSEQIIFTIEQGAVISASFIDSKSGGFYCGFVQVHGINFMCGAGSDSEIETKIPYQYENGAICGNINDAITPDTSCE